MSDFTHRLPDFNAFLATMQVTLNADRKGHLAALLEGAAGEFYCSNGYSSRWNAYWAELRIRVPPDRLAKFNAGVKTQLLECAEAIMPAEVGYDLRAVSVTPFMVGAENRRLMRKLMGTLASAIQARNPRRVLSIG